MTWQEKCDRERARLTGLSSAELSRAIALSWGSCYIGFETAVSDLCIIMEMGSDFVYARVLKRVGGSFTRACHIDIPERDWVHASMPGAVRLLERMRRWVEEGCLAI